MLNQATREFIQSHRFDDVQQLALQSKSCSDSEIDWQEAFTQISGRQSIEHKIPSWHNLDEIMYPLRISLEQCSSEITAQYKASLLSGNTLVDLTGGLGVDTAFLAKNFTQVDYIERNEKLAAIATHNFRVLGLNHIRTHSTDGITFLQQMEELVSLYRY